mmetsp:Transcript_16677/g.14556  ORF Transcript_16677/g.14556 Transcript_16677/m.14556 type:complete len:220 (+) Transcript_16677:1662-2321(+)
MHVAIIEVLVGWLLIIFGTESGKTLLINESNEGFDTGDGDKDSEVELLLVNEQGLVNVFLDNQITAFLVITGGKKVIILLDKLDAVTMFTRRGLSNEYLVLVEPKVSFKFVSLFRDQESSGDKAEFFREGVSELVQEETGGLLLAESFHTGNSVHHLMRVSSVVFFVLIDMSQDDISSIVTGVLPTMDMVLLNEHLEAFLTDSSTGCVEGELWVYVVDL